MLLHVSSIFARQLRAVLTRLLPLQVAFLAFRQGNQVTSASLVEYFQVCLRIFDETAIAAARVLLQSQFLNEAAFFCTLNPTRCSLSPTY